MTQAPQPGDQRLLTMLAGATEAMKSGDKETSISCLKNMLDVDPAHELANGMLASIYAELGMTDKAVERFKRVLEVNCDNVLARFQMGLALLTSNRNQEALDAWQPMLDLSDDFLAHFHSGIALISLGQTEQARPLLLRARERMPAAHPLAEKLQKLLDATE